jgi:hypothetical protein
MRNFIKCPDVTIYKGFKVDKSSTLTFTREDGKLKQELKDLEFIQYETRETEEYTSETKTTIHLKEGMVVLYEDENRGYVVPLERFVTIGEAHEDLECILDLDKEIKYDTTRNEEKSS